MPSLPRNAAQRAGLTILLALSLSACGMKGPLTMPPPPDPALTAPPAVAPAGAPAPDTPAAKP
uniref:LPS translocon maturation chaperone LptM n=1 Tax=Castellaniella defragrans TaxID=75697 RepID=UPI003340029A